MSKNRKAIKQFSDTLDAAGSSLVLSVGISQAGKVTSATILRPEQLKELLQGLLATI